VSKFISQPPLILLLYQSYHLDSKTVVPFSIFHLNPYLSPCGPQFQDLPNVNHKEIDIDGDGILEMVQQFCYLGDMIGAGGGSEEV
jgi:hypothetical protein